MQPYDSQEARSGARLDPAAAETAGANYTPRVTAPLPAEPPIPRAGAPSNALPYTPATRPAANTRQRAGRAPSPPMLLVLLLLLGLVAGGIGGGATAWTLAHGGATAPVATAPSAAAPQPVAAESASAISSLYTHVTNEVVDVQTTTGGGRFSGGGEGTGIVIDKSHVLTNYHVVQGANSIKIALQDGTTIDATVVGSAPQDDLALLSANLPADKVQAATLGNSDNVQVGDEVVAIGNPFGLDHTVTAGIVSAVNRSWSSGNQPVRPMIQTDAPINPGNSGGPLFNMAGEVIAINTAIESPVEGSVGVGFAIPINRAKSLLPQLNSGATVQRVWLGVSGIALDANIAQQVNAPVQKGVLVAGVTAGSPAANAGLQGADPSTSATLGDIITAIDGTAVSSAQDISAYLDGKHSGDVVTLTILRDGKQQQVKVTLAPWPAQQQQQQQPNGNGNGSPFNPGGGNSQP
jgi:S1-C subfamily serine protease